MRTLITILLCIGLSGCAASLQDRVSQAKAGYTATVNGAVAAHTLKPFPEKQAKAIGRTLQAVEAQIDAADESVKKGDEANADFWLDQAEAAIKTARKVLK